MNKTTDYEMPVVMKSPNISLIQIPILLNKLIYFLKNSISIVYFIEKCTLVHIIIIIIIIIVIIIIIIIIIVIIIIIIIITIIIIILYKVT